MKALNGSIQGRILLVEDEDLLRWSIERFLSRRGFLVDAAKNYDEAMVKLDTMIYDIVVTDLALTNEDDGLRIAAESRRRHAETQVIIITGQGSKETVIQALRQGVWDFVEKPFDLDLLLITIHKAFEKTMIIRELVHLSRTDGLTGLYNQRYFYAALESEINRARRQGHRLSLLLVDVDEFKSYNDRYGHLAGDAALTRIASCLKTACRRDIDSAFRYGGDEFILVLPEADSGTATTVADRVRILLLEEKISLTVSVGTAELQEGQDLKALIREADEAMYRNKRDNCTALVAAREAV